MVHNGIEYGLMQAYAEGFDILKGKASDKLSEDERFDLNLTDIAEVWRRGRVISSWLLDLSAAALAVEQPRLPAALVERRRLALLTGSRHADVRYCGISTWPPKPKRIADSSLSPKVCSTRLR